MSHSAPSPVLARPVVGGPPPISPLPDCLAILLQNMPRPTLAAAEVGLVVLAFMGPIGLNHLPPDKFSPHAVLLARGMLAGLVMLWGWWLLRSRQAAPNSPSRNSVWAHIFLFVSVFWPLGFEMYVERMAGEVYERTVATTVQTMPASQYYSISAWVGEGDKSVPVEAHAMGLQACDAFLRDTRLDVTAVHGLCMVILTLLLLQANGQSLPQLGLFSRGIWADVGWAVPAVFLLYTALIMSAIPILLLYLTGQLAPIQAEVATRLEVVANFLPRLSVGKLVTLMVLVGTYEEIVFRGFLVPRLRVLTKSWVLALLTAIVLFGIGHLYLGVYAVVQTSLLGLTLGLIFLWRGRLLTAILAHAAFNSIQFGLIDLLRQWHFVEKAQEMLRSLGH